jgi:hypothetical protein
MKERSCHWCIAARAVRLFMLTLALTLAPAASDAGVRRDELPAPCTPGKHPTSNVPDENAPCAAPAEVAPHHEATPGKSASKDAGAHAVSEKIFQLPGVVWGKAKQLAKVIKEPSPASGKAAGSSGSAGLSGSSRSPALPRRGYACCNLHYAGDSINDSNYAELPMVPPGTPIEVVSYARDKAYVKVDGKPIWLRHEYGRDRETLESWVNKLVVEEDPRPRIAGYPPQIREAIHEGKVMVGMTREQAIASIGYPLPNENITLDAPTWRVWRSRRGEYQLNFRSDGSLGSVTGDDEVTGLMTYRQRR